mmetsp:Transcript_31589/g.53350  ORF Transcript_31589/g.53350 Transcript_31589/m.53350 type:complete len:296 (-) Transcript_31589:35-922(-)
MRAECFRIREVERATERARCKLPLHHRVPSQAVQLKSSAKIAVDHFIKLNVEVVGPHHLAAHHRIRAHGPPAVPFAVADLLCGRVPHFGKVGNLQAVLHVKRAREQQHRRVVRLLQAHEAKAGQDAVGRLQMPLVQRRRVAVPVTLVCHGARRRSAVAPHSALPVLQRGSLVTPVRLGTPAGVAEHFHEAVLVLGGDYVVVKVEVAIAPRLHRGVQPQARPQVKNVVVGVVALIHASRQGPRKRVANDAEGEVAQFGGRLRHGFVSQVGEREPRARPRNLAFEPNVALVCDARQS